MSEQPNPEAETPSHEDLVNTVPCPTCHVGTGARCITRAGKSARDAHGRRYEALEQAAGITQHRAAVRSQTPTAWWSTGIDRKAEESLLAAYAARTLPCLAVTA